MNVSEGRNGTYSDSVLKAESQPWMSPIARFRTRSDLRDRPRRPVLGPPEVLVGLGVICDLLGLGVPLGASKANHAALSKPARPASAAVGTSGRVIERVFDETDMAQHRRVSAASVAAHNGLNDRIMLGMRQGQTTGRAELRAAKRREASAQRRRGFE